MQTQTPSTRLSALLAYLDGLTCRAAVEDLERMLRDLDVSLDDVAESVRFSERQYQRNLVRAGKWYHVLVLCWKSGQRSPIHNHAKSTCGLRILKGVATETIFEPTPSGLLKAVSSTDYHAGDVAASQDSDTHQVSNLQATGNDLVTLHIYSPPLLKMDTFSLTDATVGEWCPMILEHVHGSGI